MLASDDGAFVTRLRLRDSEVADMALVSGRMTERDLQKHFRIRDSFLKSLGRAEPREEDWAAALEALPVSSRAASTAALASGRTGEVAAWSR